MKPTSTISIKLDGEEISQHVVFRESSFTMQANPMQGSFQITVRDDNQTFGPLAGQKMTCHIDGVPLFGGYVMVVKRMLFHPVEDTSDLDDVLVRKWVLSGPDYNFIFDKRVLRDLSNLSAALSVPSGKRTISKAFKYMMDNFLDVPPGLDYSTYVDNIRTAYGSESKGSLLVGQSKTWRSQMEDFMDHGAVIYYIDADFKIHLHEYEQATVPWLLTDYHPNGTTSIGFREGEYTEDLTQVVTEALVWGGSTIRTQDGGPGGDIVFARYPKSPANSQTVFAGTESEQTFTAAKEQEALDRRTLYGRWQMAEEHAGQENYLSQDSVLSRAYTIINGPPGAPPTHGIEGGFGKPIVSMRAAWFAHDVPSAQHLRPGFLMDFTLYTQDKFFTLPCRSITVTFPARPDNDPGETWVRFDGDFGIQASDRRYLWKAMRQGRRQLLASDAIVSADGTSEDVPAGALLNLGVNETPDGSRTTFTFPHTLYAGGFFLYVNGITQREGIDYTYTAATKTVVFATAPGTGDIVWAVGEGSL